MSEASVSQVNRFCHFGLAVFSSDPLEIESPNLVKLTWLEMEMPKCRTLPLRNHGVNRTKVYKMQIHRIRQQKGPFKGPLLHLHHHHHRHHHQYQFPTTGPQEERKKNSNIQPQTLRLDVNHEVDLSSSSHLFFKQILVCCLDLGWRECDFM